MSMLQIRTTNVFAKSRRAEQLPRSLVPEQGASCWRIAQSPASVPVLRLKSKSEAICMTIAAKYEDGVFKPLEQVKIEEGTLVEVRVPSYADRLRGKPRSLKDFAFYGMW